MCVKRKGGCGGCDGAEGAFQDKGDICLDNC
ncbi:MAG: hypothetical protein MW690_000975 [Methanophagales archaeon]|nr:hypothetical protein [Methanophagales archaeon]